jgi:hypothetical protein
VAVAVAGDAGELAEELVGGAQRGAVVGTRARLARSSSVSLWSGRVIAISPCLVSGGLAGRSRGLRGVGGACSESGDHTA